MIRWLVPLSFSLCLHLLAGGLAVAAALPAPPEAADEVTFDAWLADQRQTVAQQRAAAREHYNEQEFVCWRRFAVNDCLHAARVQRRQQLDDLRQRDLHLNDLERARRTEKRLGTIAAKRRERRLEP